MLKLTILAVYLVRVILAVSSAQTQDKPQPSIFIIWVSIA
jgi:hypothetical protein